MRSTFNGYSYVIAYTYKFIKLFLPGVTLHQVLLFVPTACFLIGVAVLCPFLYVRFGISVAAIVGILLIIMPGIDRSTAGFSDRDAWCWMLATLTLARLFLTFLIITLFGKNIFIDTVAIVTTALIFILDAVDGYMARRTHTTSLFGAVFDMAADRIIENVFFFGRLNLSTSSLLSETSGDKNWTHPIQSIPFIIYPTTSDVDSRSIH